MSSRTFPGAQSSESHPLLWTLVVEFKRTKTPPDPAQCGGDVQGPRRLKSPPSPCGQTKRQASRARQTPPMSCRGPQASEMHGGSPGGLAALPRPPPRPRCSTEGHTLSGRTLAEGVAREACTSRQPESRGSPPPPRPASAARGHPRAPAAADRPRAAANSEKVPALHYRLSQRKLGPQGTRRAQGNSHAVPGTRTSPHRAELPTPTHTPQAGSRFPPAPSYLPAWAGEPRAGGARPGESCRELCLGKVGGTAGGGGPGCKLGIPG